MEQVARRIHAPRTSPLDIYVWADGRVTGPPTGDESGDAKLVTLVTPEGGSTPDLDEIRETILKGVETAPDEPVDVALPTAMFEEEPPEPASPDGQ